jgi:hypothetical protein
MIDTKNQIKCLKITDSYFFNICCFICFVIRQATNEKFFKVEDSRSIHRDIHDKR